MGRIKKSSKHLISLIIPTYRQQRTIRHNLQKIKNVMRELRYDYEIIVVVDGNTDNTFREAKKIRDRHIKIFTYPQNHGKGYAIRYGMSRTKGDIVAFIDSGMDLNANGLSMLLEHFEWYKADIIVGSKLHPVSKVKYPFYRHIMSMGYRMLVKILFGLSIRDTQVGMKFYKRKVLEKVLPRLLVKTMAFDIEILAVAYALGWKRIYEAPVELHFKESATITSANFWRVIFEMLWDTCAVFYRLKIIHYYDKPSRIRYKHLFGNTTLRVLLR